MSLEDCGNRGLELTEVSVMVVVAGVSETTDVTTGGVDVSVLVDAAAVNGTVFVVVTGGRVTVPHGSLVVTDEVTVEPATLVVTIVV